MRIKSHAFKFLKVNILFFSNAKLLFLSCLTCALRTQVNMTHNKKIRKMLTGAPGALVKEANVEAFVLKNCVIKASKVKKVSFFI
jgi:hypothetical protein